MSAAGRRPLASEGTKIASVRQRDLHVSIVRGVADGFRAGVGAVPLDGFAAHSTMEHLVIVNERKGRRRRLSEELDLAKSLAKKARRMAVEESDDDVVEGYREDARRHSDRARRLAAELQRLADDEVSTHVPPQFDGEVGFLMQGLASLLSEDGNMSRDQRAAWQSVVHDFVVDPGGDLLTWRLSLRVPADGKVLVLGPFTGTVKQCGRTVTPAEAAQIQLSTPSAAQRRPVIAALMAAGYPRMLARAASMAAHPLLVDVLLERAVTWPGCTPGYDDEAFSSHIRKVWTAHPGWTPGTYAHTSVKRQALADLVACLGGSATVEELKRHTQLAGLDDIDLYALTQNRGGKKQGTPPWPPSVVRAGEWSKGSGSDASVVASRMCPRCGKPATAVVRVPEVTAALLCRNCLVMPGRPDLVFPPLYLGFALPPTNPALLPPVRRPARPRSTSTKA